MSRVLETHTWCWFNFCSFNKDQSKKGRFREQTLWKVQYRKKFSAAVADRGSSSCTTWPPESSTIFQGVVYSRSNTHYAVPRAVVALKAQQSSQWKKIFFRTAVSIVVLQLSLDSSSSRHIDGIARMQLYRPCRFSKLSIGDTSVLHSSQRRCVPRHPTLRRHKQRVAGNAVTQTEASELSSDSTKLFQDLTNAYDLYRRAPPSEVNVPASHLQLGS